VELNDSVVGLDYSMSVGASEGVGFLDVFIGGGGVCSGKGEGGAGAETMFEDAGCGGFVLVGGGDSGATLTGAVVLEA